jgi:hypothetical protein
MAGLEKLGTPSYAVTVTIDRTVNGCQDDPHYQGAGRRKEGHEIRYLIAHGGVYSPVGGL